VAVTPPTRSKTRPVGATTRVVDHAYGLVYTGAERVPCPRCRCHVQPKRKSWRCGDQVPYFCSTCQRWFTRRWVCRRSKRCGFCAWVYQTAVITETRESIGNMRREGFYALAVTLTLKLRHRETLHSVVKRAIRRMEALTQVPQISDVRRTKRRPGGRKQKAPLGLIRSLAQSDEGIGYITLREGGPKVALKHAKRSYAMAWALDSGGNGRAHVHLVFMLAEGWGHDANLVRRELRKAWGLGMVREFQQLTDLEALETELAHLLRPWAPWTIPCMDSALRRPGVTRASRTKTPADVRSGGDGAEVQWRSPPCVRFYGRWQTVSLRRKRGPKPLDPCANCDADGPRRFSRQQVESVAAGDLTSAGVLVRDVAGARGVCTNALTYADARASAQEAADEVGYLEHEARQGRLAGPLRVDAARAALEALNVAANHALNKLPTEAQVRKARQPCAMPGCLNLAVIDTLLCRGCSAGAQPAASSSSGVAQQAAARTAPRSAASGRAYATAILDQLRGSAAASVQESGGLIRGATVWHPSTPTKSK
jgi:hypothetical protein